MIACDALLSARSKQATAHMASAPNPLPWLFVDQTLATSLTWPLENYVVRVRVVVVGGQKGGLPFGLEHGDAAFPARNLLGFSTLGRVALVLGGSTGRALLRRRPVDIAGSTGTADTHANRFVHAKSGSLGRIPFVLLDLQPVFLAKSPGTFLEQLLSLNSAHALRSFAFAIVENPTCGGRRLYRCDRRGIAGRRLVNRHGHDKAEV